MYLKIDIREMEQLGLEGREMLVYSALRVLTYKKPWGGSYSELAQISRCGGKTTAYRAVEVLIEKGLLFQCVDGLSLFQNGTKAFQNGTSPSQNGTKAFQNGTISERKSNQKESIYNNKKESVCDNNNINIAPHTPTDYFLEKREVNRGAGESVNRFTPPEWVEFRDFCVERDIRQGAAVKCWAYYKMIGWRGVVDWKAAVVYWDLRNKS